MTVSELMKAMADAGAPFEAILIAVRAIEAKDAEIAARDAQVAEKKAKDAARKRNVRGTSEENPRNVRGNGADIPADHPLSPSPLPSPQTPEPTPHPHTPENITPREAEDAHVAAWLAWWDRDPFPRPDWAPARLWADFRRNRKTKRLTNTFTAYAQQLAKIRELSRRTGWPPGEVLEDCVARGWGAVFETDKMKAAINGHGTGNRQQSPRHHGGRDNRDGFKRACDDWIDEAGRSATGGNGAGGQLALGGPDSL
jgi:hypothetical protein